MIGPAVCTSRSSPAMVSTVLLSTKERRTAAAEYKLSMGRGEGRKNERSAEEGGRNDQVGRRRVVGRERATCDTPTGQAALSCGRYSRKINAWAGLPGGAGLVAGRQWGMDGARPMWVFDRPMMAARAGIRRLCTRERARARELARESQLANERRRASEEARVGNSGERTGSMTRQHKHVWRRPPSLRRWR